MVIDMQRYFVQAEYPWGKAVTKVFPDDAPDYFVRVRNVIVPNCQKLQRPFRHPGQRRIHDLRISPQKWDGHASFGPAD